ncbi:hypothetical protein FSARC_4947 [Fusarium sarcochroum]|uniref:Carbohydrate kinase PfkB domain-containing protein n=1 Tax=Fusarium sarcochroum TaxID=1208366 RepID=A0A8H4XA34_9HYPO|nr:hypothetical protein FSARC_4947 [Fusarium sarcochroum]
MAVNQTQSISQCSNDPVFVSLGMVVLDERRYPSREPLYDIPGGSGLYATLGARLVQYSSNPSRIGSIILAGHDFPESLLEQIQAWGMTMQVKRLHDSPSTRGSLEYQYDDFGRKMFKYLTPPLQPWPSDLESTTLLNSSCFHILATPDDLDKHVAALLSRRIQGKPLIIWEPAPLACNNHHINAHLDACRLVDVFSPNHIELELLVRGTQDVHPFSRQATEYDARSFLDAGVGHDGEGIVVSEAEWLPAFYDSGSPMVVDTTGAGNAFLGGFSIGLQATKDPQEAAILGSVAASFALEQVGLPKFTPAS